MAVIYVQLVIMLLANFAQPILLLEHGIVFSKGDTVVEPHAIIPHLFGVLGHPFLNGRSGFGLSPLSIQFIGVLQLPGLRVTPCCFGISFMLAHQNSIDTLRPPATK